MLLKIGMAILVSLIAAMISVIAGLTSDVRTGTVLLRAVFIFAISGFGLTFGLFWIEKYGIPLYESRHEKEDSEWLRLYKMLKEMEKQDGQEPEEELPAEEIAEEAPSLVDVSVSDELPPEPITEEELMSLNGETGDELPAEEETGEELIEGSGAEAELPEETEELPSEEIVEKADNIPEEKAPEFAPLSVDSMTRLKVPAEGAGA